MIHVQGLGATSNVQHAINRNKAWAATLGWGPYAQSLFGAIDTSTFVAAAKLYQQQHPGLEVDGIVGPKSWRVMLNAARGTLSAAEFAAFERKLAPYEGGGARVEPNIIPPAPPVGPVPWWQKPGVKVAGGVALVLAAVLAFWPGKKRGLGIVYPTMKE